MPSPEAPSASRIGVGIVGLSAKRGWAAAAHLPALRALEDYEVVALSASSEESARAAGQAHGIELTFGDAAEMVARPEVNLVVVTVRVPSHFDPVAEAVAAGKDVHCEWPLGVDLAQAERMRDLANTGGVRGTVGLQARSLPVIRFLADYIAAGEIGEVLSTTVLGSGERWGATVPEDVRYLIDRDNGATMLTIPLGHTLDAVCHCLGELAEVSAVTATRRRVVVVEPGGGGHVPMSAEDQVALSGLLESGAVASFHYRGGRSPGTNFLWEIEGSRRTLILRGETGHLQYGRIELRVGEAGARQAYPLPVPASYAAALPGIKPDSLPYAVGQAYARLRDAPRTVPSFGDAVIRHRSLAAIQASAADGRRRQLA